MNRPMNDEYRQQQVAAILARGISRIPLKSQPTVATKRSGDVGIAGRPRHGAAKQDDALRLFPLTTGEQ
jgi:hypothetical protein